MLCVHGQQFSYVLVTVEIIWTIVLTIAWSQSRAVCWTVSYRTLGGAHWAVPLLPCSHMMPFRHFCSFLTSHCFCIKQSSSPCSSGPRVLTLESLKLCFQGMCLGQWGSAQWELLLQNRHTRMHTHAHIQEQQEQHRSVTSQEAGTSNLIRLCIFQR